MRQIKTASVFEYLLVHCSLFKFDDKMNWISGLFFKDTVYRERVYRECPNKRRRESLLRALFHWSVLSRSVLVP